MNRSCRVVSLLPSATEMLAAVGGIDLLVGRSHECDFPAGLESLPVLTGQRTHATTSIDIDAQVRAIRESGDNTESDSQSLYTLDETQLTTLRPDVILTQSLCDVCSIDLDRVQAVVAAMPGSPEIISLDPHSIEDVLDDLLTIGRAIDNESEAQRAIVDLRERYWSAVDFVNPYVFSHTVAFLEWMDPLFGAGHWTPQLIEAAGGQCVLGEAGQPSRQYEPEDLLAAAPSHLIICPCGFDLPTIERELETLQRQRWWKLVPAVMDGHVVAVDGNQMFNRPGPRLVDAFRWLVGWLNHRPEVIPADFPVRPVGNRPAAS